MNDIATQFAAILGRLCGAVGAFLAAQARGPHRAWIGTQLYVAIAAPTALPVIPLETWTQLTHRLNRLARSFRALFAHYLAGTLITTSRPSRAGTPDPRAPAPRLPATNGWIGAHIAAAAPCAGGIEQLLHNEPEMRQFLSQAPQAGRLLRPLCRMLGVTLPPYLRLPPRPKPCFSPLALGRREPEGGSCVAEPNSEPPPGTPFRPIPRNILAAARAWRRKNQ